MQDGSALPGDQPEVNGGWTGGSDGWCVEFKDNAWV
jgi:hypothetical protein